MGDGRRRSSRPIQPTVEENGEAQWKLVRRDLGKELVLLAWAIEDADPALIPTAIANWNGLVPEERWWLYTQTAAATGHAQRSRARLAQGGALRADREPRARQR